MTLDLIEQPPTPIMTMGDQRRYLSIAHVAEYGRRFIGEPLALYTRVIAERAMPEGFRLRITMPPEFRPEGYHMETSAKHSETVPRILPGDNLHYVIWTVNERVAPGERFEFRLDTTIDEVLEDTLLETYAVAQSNTGDDEADDDDIDVDDDQGEVAAVYVQLKGNYLKFLPAIYDSDELMARFLMLFESFWAPIEQQVEAIDTYFDPNLTPVNFLPWLGSWLHMSLDDRLSEAQWRELVRSASTLYRKRGTRQGLVHYLKILTGEEPQIVEHRANNFVIGENAIMGQGIALGLDNHPHTFTVNLQLPAITSGGSIEANERLELERRNMLEAIIEMEKPAHTGYRLHIELID